MKGRTIGAAAVALLILTGCGHKTADPTDPTKDDLHVAAAYFSSVDHDRQVSLCKEYAPMPIGDATDSMARQMAPTIPSTVEAQRKARALIDVLVSWCVPHRSEWDA